MTLSLVRRLNTVYVAVWTVAGVDLRRNRWTWSERRAEKWVRRLNEKHGLDARVERTRLI